MRMAVGCAGGVSTGEGGELDVAGDCSDGKIRENWGRRWISGGGLLQIREDSMGDGLINCCREPKEAAQREREGGDDKEAVEDFGGG
ncbi:hypothetical protein RCL_jg198.t1 [Rhizophagus clarus]|uniref:Uncharacterized protein n=1 Tax=Rhizophagus clarus TaxID=94130 RepID=A0A8H3QNA0_9GLOM|nr:hypothetical protein RCL_jg198.t1 [Rhizophagus clarus]